MLPFLSTCAPPTTPQEHTAQYQDSIEHFVQFHTTLPVTIGAVSIFIARIYANGYATASFALRFYVTCCNSDSDLPQTSSIFVPAPNFQVCSNKKFDFILDGNQGCDRRLKLAISNLNSSLQILVCLFFFVFTLASLLLSPNSL